MTHKINALNEQFRIIKKGIKVIFFLACLLPAMQGHAQQTTKIEKMIQSIKDCNDNEKQDYVTDGQRTVWVKSYKNWTPDDLVVMKKESPGTLRFLGMAAQRGRYDILDQLLPAYYNDHGGAKAFAADILKVQPPITEKN